MSAKFAIEADSAAKYHGIDANPATIDGVIQACPVVVAGMVDWAATATPDDAPTMGPPGG